MQMDVVLGDLCIKFQGGGSIGHCRINNLMFILNRSIDYGVAIRKCSLGIRTFSPCNLSVNNDTDNYQLSLLLLPLDNIRPHPVRVTNITRPLYHTGSLEEHLIAIC